ncbi:glycosyltransferase family 4 protein [Bacillus suaedaesalsae]|uniref:Glycosyltransferase family 4 protein n=1 Tax=Bacillus suaedaesalsae TaxID=2810349 RepID=A0ABS2DIJ2_9BACI|nr:glycosyltransferase family 4 protein [Bacillus suaedaesalsae]MBM6618319.1 glycosyltransferase family 4 protein [Bacillus suaedaesalsae]
MNKKIAFFTPYYKSNRGNATTTKRIVHGLKEAGIDVHVFPYLEERWTDKKEEILKECEIYHILHLYRFAKWNMCRELPLDKPYILTNGGTDINHDLANPAQLEEMKKMIEGAAFISVFTQDGKEKVLAAYPNSSVEIIPQSVWFENEQKLSLEVPAGKPIILLPAGLRAVKDPLYVWDEIQGLKMHFPDLQFIIAGVVIEEEVSKEVLRLCQNHDWVHFLEDVPFSQMKSLYEQADLTINTSISEGQPSSIMEAMYCGCPVLVRNNEGNISVVDHNRTGLVFTNKSEFVEMAYSLLTDVVKTNQLTQCAKQYILDHHSLEKEIEHYIALYNQLV